MHAVELLEEALELAAAAGFAIRREWLGESVGGACRIGPQWTLFVDLSLPANEQLEQVVRALQGRSWVHPSPSASPQLLKLLNGGHPASRP